MDHLFLHHHTILLPFLITRPYHHQQIKDLKQCSQILLTIQPGIYRITLYPSIPPVQHKRCRMPIEAKEEIEVQLKEMNAPGIFIQQAEPTPLVSSLTYLCKSNVTQECALAQTKTPQNTQTRRDHIPVSRLNYIL